jgi:hypothetical protein
MGEAKHAYKVLVGKLYCKRSLERSDVDGKLLKQVLKKQGVGCGLYLINSG